MPEPVIVSVERAPIRRARGGQGSALPTGQVNR